MPFDRVTPNDGVISHRTAVPSLCLAARTIGYVVPFDRAKSEDGVILYRTDMASPWLDARTIGT